ncbi:hypothetical protein [Mucilaginibacter dorajii]|uniref:Uncharacterized protein n=1 Tax=Mucilaginibacter dorajii TaxID=692994 RepID=A0ABP7RAE8_9SPHI|nr:hypothetical protein [Mucilaginibacter dorajii]MCS3736774.1 hypothetical protein [Mucilaginibacter dorajii]
MDSFYFFAILGSVVVVLIIYFDTQQRRKVKKTLVQTNDVEPLLMMQSMSQKLEKLNKAIKQAGSVPKIEAQLQKSTADYKSGKINMDTYNRHLNQLLHMTEEHLRSSFVH